ncbi:MAG: hypothetical protein AB8H79_21565 [Myxococcota bacterium]
MWFVWSFMSALAAPPSPQTPECAAAVQAEIQAEEVAKQALDETVDRAKASPGITQLTSELQTLTNIWAYHERSTATVDQITTTRSDANIKIELLLAQLEAQWSIDEQVRTAERDRMLAAVAHQEATCAADACTDDPTCEGKPHAGTSKIVGQVTGLYSKLSQAESDFRNHYSYKVLLGRVRGGGVAERHVGTDQARAAWLLSYLATSAVRPSRARARVAAFLASTSGRPRISGDDLRYGRHLMIWSAERDRRLKGLDDAIDHVIDTWVRLDAARSVGKPAPNVLLAIERLRQHETAPPPSIGNFR